MNMATVAAAAITLGFNVEHMRIALPAYDAAQRQQVAMFGGGIVLAAAYMYPGPVRTFNAFVEQATGINSPMLAAAGLGVLYYVGAEYLHPMLMSKSPSA
ncbi:hypothetical protein T492DRAFT_885120 [Pavlovales sp. CCMP2436]|nr:hypothetical protein T492DRAFT_885120 [Pavlovales sp. CCMP2436]|mmetsp:Transcript_12878/g.33273  ORF Transcript_12878/g.33273 Transcript_12878/m.33273 type:complete len:100 (+) Transcript_12878:108-407(+)